MRALFNMETPRSLQGAGKAFPCASSGWLTRWADRLASYVARAAFHLIQLQSPVRPPHVRCAA